MDSIKWIIDGWRYWDKTNGNSYYLTRVTHTGTGKSAIFEECGGNMSAIISRMECQRGGNHWAGIHCAPFEDISRREWQRKLKYCEITSNYEVIAPGKGCRNVALANIRALTRKDMAAA